jgi:hypothetical protein
LVPVVVMIRHKVLAFYKVASTHQISRLGAKFAANHIMRLPLLWTETECSQEA